jgi:spore maturation protein CgeB
VAGSQYPAALTWPANVERVDHVPPDQHRDFYCGQRFTLSITRADMMRAGFSPSVRLFEAAGCGVPIITDRWPGLETFFDPGREILVADSAEDVVAHLTTIDDEQRHQIARRARQRVLAEHTAAHRAAQLEGYVAELRALPAQRRRAQGA